MKFYDWLDTQEQNLGTAITEARLFESIKTEIDTLGADSIKRSGKMITLTWKKDMDIAAIKKTITDKLKAFADKIKFIGTEKLGAGIKAEIVMA